MNFLLEKLSIDDLPSPELKELAKQTSIGFVKEIIIKCSGMRIYIPKNINRVFIESYINDNFKGDNYNSLAKTLDVTPRTVRRYVKKIMDKKRTSSTYL